MKAIISREKPSSGLPYAGGGWLYFVSMGGSEPIEMGHFLNAVIKWAKRRGAEEISLAWEAA